MIEDMRARRAGGRGHGAMQDAWAMAHGHWPGGGGHIRILRRTTTELNLAAAPEPTTPRGRLEEAAPSEPS